MIRLVVLVLFAVLVLSACRHTPTPADTSADARRAPTEASRSRPWRTLDDSDPPTTVTTAAAATAVARSAPITSKPAGQTVARATNFVPGRYLGTFYATCYDYASAGTRTASGATVSEQAVAVDPSVIPLGTRLSIPGVPHPSRTAEDTGGAIRGHRIDVWMPSCDGWPNRNVEVWTAA